MSIAFIACGSNLGNRAAQINEAISKLQQNGINILKRSTFIETDPIGGPPQNKYINAAIKIETRLSPNALLELCLKIEKDLGRIRTVKNSPRTIDLDLLLFDDIRLNSKKLTLPHPRMLERDFVLIPLKEIAPEISKEWIDACH